MPRNSTPPPTLQKIPKKWAVAIVIALIFYALVQPLANGRFGWHLPSLGGVLGMDKPVASNSVEPSARVGSGSSAAKPSEQSETPATGQVDSQVTEPQRGEAELAPSKPDASENLLYGLLKDTGREVYVSPAGLRYTRGSEEGHRLKHLKKHLKDIPDRPGKHGVFDGDMAQVLRWIDDAYTRGKQGAKGVRQRDEDGRTVYEVPFTKTIGFIGGRDGKRDNNPDAERLRLVVDGDQVITAFPF